MSFFMSMETACTLIAIIAYLLVIIAIGVAYSTQNTTANDFYLGGRSLGPLVTAMSAEASDMSGWLLMGLPGVAYLCGIADATWTAIGLALGTYINWLIVAKRIRRYSLVAGDSITLPDFFSRRYHDSQNILMCISAIVIIVFFIPYTASGFVTCGKLFSTFLGMEYMHAMILGVIIVVGYTALGGFMAASTSDLVQSIIMTIGFAIVFFFGIHVAGGVDSIINYTKDLPGYLSFTLTHDTASGTASGYGILTIISTLAWGLGYFGMPHVLLRFMAIKEEKKLDLSRRIATTWVVLSLAAAVLTGIIGYAMSQTGSIPILQGSNSETIVVEIARLIGTYGAFPALITGIILAGILAATMSTTDSQLLAASSSVSENIVKGVFRINLSDKSAIVIARVMVIGIALIAMIVASNPESSIFNIVSFAWAGFGAAFGPVVLFSLFWRRANKWGALAGMVSGGIMVFVWKFLLRPLGGAWNIYELLPAFIIACLAIVIFSLLTKEPSEEITKEFDKVVAMKNLN